MSSPVYSTEVSQGVRLGQPPTGPPLADVVDGLDELGPWLVELPRQCPTGVLPGISPGELPGVFSGVLLGF